MLEEARVRAKNAVPTSSSESSITQKKCAQPKSRAANWPKLPPKPASKLKLVKKKPVSDITKYWIKSDQDSVRPKHTRRR
jgi:hypothetical protein